MPRISLRQAPMVMGLPVSYHGTTPDNTANHGGSPSIKLQMVVLREMVGVQDTPTPTLQPAIPNPETRQPPQYHVEYIP